MDAQFFMVQEYNSKVYFMKQTVEMHSFFIFSLVADLLSITLRKWNPQAYGNGIRKHTEMESAWIRKLNPHVLSHVVFTEIESASSVS